MREVAGLQGSLMAKVLLVDDHPDLRDVVTELLEMHGHRVQVCIDGEEALEHLARELPDAVIADDRLPGISGLELLRTIRRHPKLARIPVFICSADETPRDAAQQSGATDFWLKGSDVLFDGLEQLGQLLRTH
jgi:CheY-like chemotaxis protein